MLRHPRLVGPCRWIGVLTALLPLACGPERRRGEAQLHVTVRVSPTPATVGPNRILVDVGDLGGSPQDRATVTLVATAPGGVVEPVADTAHSEGTGRYVVPAFRFPEAGEWTLTARVELPGGSWIEVDHPVRVVSSPP